jgi:hypothetical protein
MMRDFRMTATRIFMPQVTPHREAILLQLTHRKLFLRLALVVRGGAENHW